jgi:hypothetical protein
MSYSLQLRNGDLVVDRGRLGFVTGPQKLVQDIRCALLEKMGTDDLHPEFGSILDGGTVDGEEMEGIIGETDPEVIRSFVATEVNRIITAYRNAQINRAQADRLTYNKTTLSMGEALADAEINMGMIADTLVVQIILHAESGDTKTIAIPYSI